MKKHLASLLPFFYMSFLFSAPEEEEEETYTTKNKSSSSSSSSRSSTQSPHHPKCTTVLFGGNSKISWAKLRNREFLLAKRSSISKNDDILIQKDFKREREVRRASLQSVPLHDAVSAPQDVGNEWGSEDGDS
ncbi:hypothetical protein Sjap_026240 [Stephania japonica]|uniref:Uncharacterized protein n=1 Tax=Stephania japonica TaxID=461633 RepID=A0AAP0HGA5_9MAGN